LLTPPRAALVARFNPKRFRIESLPREGEAISVPGLEVRAPTRSLGWNHRHVAIVLGRPRFHDAHARREHAERGAARGLLKLLERQGDAFLGHLSGDFALAVIDLHGSRLTLATDRFGQHPVFYREDEDGTLSFAGTPGDLGTSISAQGLFNYFHGHVIGAPDSVIEGVHRLSAASALVADKSGTVIRPHWRAAFEPLHTVATPALAAQFRRLVRDAVERNLHDTHTGCFLSGGTDSSTVAGMLSKITGARVATYSIGFDVAGYDELDYAQTAAAHFDCAHHAHTLQAQELIELIPALAAATDQPFGNSSLAPTFACAKLAAAHGTRELLAGDGGDELFGGNTRYAETLRVARWQRRFGWLGGPLSGAARLAPPGLQARIQRAVGVLTSPMPERMWRHNLLDEIGLAQLFTPDFLAQVDTRYPTARLGALWAQKQSASLLDTQLAYDWQVTLADNDLPKVRTACAMAGVGVGFPLLDERLVDFSLALAPALKVRGTRLRGFFKYALRDFLPQKILRKQKHGFGLPFGHWLLAHAPLHEFAREAMDSLARRGVLRAEFSRSLVDPLLTAHPPYFGEIVWIAVALEHWLRAHHPDWRLA